jgi:hypothetical protein
MESWKRILLFLLVCIPLRSLLAWWSSLKESREDYTQRIAIGIITTLIGIGLLVFGIIRISSNNYNTGFSGGKVYWNSLLHGTLYLLFACLWLDNSPDNPDKFKNLYSILVTDIVIGILYFLKNYYF